MLGGLAAWTQRRRAAAAAWDGGEGEGGRRRDLELRLVQVVFRHGARTPLRPIPGAAPVSSGPDGLGVVREVSRRRVGGMPAAELLPCSRQLDDLAFIPLPEAIPRVISKGRASEFGSLHPMPRYRLG